MRNFFRPRNFFPRSEVFRAQTRAYISARLLVRCYYAALLYFALALLPDWQGILARSALVPLWPVAWLGRVELRHGILFVLVLYLLGAFFGAVLPEKRWARALAFLGLFEFVAFNNSFGKIGHSLHVWVLTAFLLIFLPEFSKTFSRGNRQRFLTIFWGCQATLLLIYTMSGLGKILGAFYQIGLGETNAFMPSALASIVAQRLLETNSRSLLGPWLIDHPLAGWPIMLGDLYLQLFAFCAAFRPSLHKPWAIALILFHIASFLFLTINFAPNALLLALFLILSPFRSPEHNWQHSLGDLPLFGSFFARIFGRPCAS